MIIPPWVRLLIAAGALFGAFGAGWYVNGMRHDNAALRADAGRQEALNEALLAVKARTLVNLASAEYFKSVATKKLAVPVIQPVFEDWSAGKFKVVSFHAKRARGLMARFALVERLKKVDGLKQFSGEGYAYAASASDETRWVFRRQLQ